MDDPRVVAHSEEQKQVVFDRVSDAVFALDTQWQFTYANPTAIELLRTSAEELCNGTVWQILSEIQGTTIGKTLRRAMNKQQTETVETYCHQHDRWYNMRVYPDSEGLTVFMQDTTDRQKGRSYLQSFKSMVNELEHSVIITDTDGIIEYANTAAVEKTGYSREELQGNTPRILKSGEHKKALYADLWETILSGHKWRGELVNERKTGERYIIDQTITPVTDKSGSPIKFIAVNREISNQKLRKQRLEVLNRILRHNLRNSATVIHGYAEEIKSSIAENESRIAEIIKDEAVRLIEVGEEARQFDELLTETTQNESVNLSSVVCQIKEEFQSQDKAVDIQLNICPNDTVQADKDLLTVILREIFENAVEHNDTATPKVSVKTKRVDQHMTICIQDTGPGIPEEELRPLIDGTETALHHGSGLGLWLIKWGIRQMQGAVSFNNIDSGTKVKLVLPTTG
ncbi:PAS domain-containing protein [Salinarchaeum sp. IM2453]|uniref:PAS domain-containing sensor histidine kinase n=1 Tax=Salinarchaeum sp. IM2453 TaxID=2862870 RepID=UPI001C838CC6|nr:PAS domain-containing sensor histidine kinase [Salinarchaeum sp. IM2453]QZA88127.1 PAS domain-containing protein [Salinarchaeum sp. IM2453]